MRNDDIKDKITKINNHISDLEMIADKKRKVMNVQEWLSTHRVKSVSKFWFKKKLFSFEPLCNLIFDVGYIKRFTGIQLFLLNNEVTIQQCFKNIKIKSGVRREDRWNEDILIIKGWFSKIVITGYRLS